MLAAAEVITIAAFDHVSRAQQREISQRAEGQRFCNRAKSPHVAVLGNSLMLDGVDVSLLQSKLDSKLVPAPYFRARHHLLRLAVWTSERGTSSFTASLASHAQRSCTRKHVAQWHGNGSPRSNGSAPTTALAACL